MNIEVEVVLSKAYYQEFYGEWLTFRSKYRKRQPLVGVLLIGWAGVLYTMIGVNSSSLLLIPLLFVLLGVYEIGQF